MLKPNGYLYIEVPNSPMKDQCNYEMLMRYLSTEHIVNFNKDNLIKFIEKAGLNIIQSSYSNYKVPVNNELLRANILEGSLPNINNIFSFSIFALKMLIYPKSIFIDYSDNNNIWSYGENIRVISNL